MTGSRAALLVPKRPSCVSGEGRRPHSRRRWIERVAGLPPSSGFALAAAPEVDAVRVPLLLLG